MSAPDASSLATARLPMRRDPGHSGWPVVRPSRPRWLDVVGVLGVVALGFTVWLGLWITPPDAVQGNLARLLYIHPPVATVALYWVGLVAAGGSLLYLWPRTRSFFWDRLAASAVEVGAVFSALTLITGSLWGRPAWGTWWTWDARLTSTAPAAHPRDRVPGSAPGAGRPGGAGTPVRHRRAAHRCWTSRWCTSRSTGGTRCTKAARSSIPGFKIHASASMSWTFLLGFVAFSLVFVWLLGVRYQIEVLQDAVGDEELEVSLAERWSEDTGLVPVTATPAGRCPERTVSYVDAGYAVALGGLALYAVSLVLRRRRWERALRDLGAARGRRRGRPGRRRALVSTTADLEPAPQPARVTEAHPGPPVPPPRPTPASELAAS